MPVKNQSIYDSDNTIKFVNPLKKKPLTGTKGKDNGRHTDRERQNKRNTNRT